MLALFLLAVIAVLTLVFVRFLRAGEAADHLMDVALSPNGRRLMRVFFALVIVFLYAPIAILLVFSFNSSPVPSSRSAASRSAGTTTSSRTADMRAALEASAIVAAVSSVVAVVARDPRRDRPHAAPLPRAAGP